MLDAALTPSGSSAADLTFEPQRIDAPPGNLVVIRADWTFDEWSEAGGTNPCVTDAAFSTTEYCSRHEISDGVLWVQTGSYGVLLRVRLRFGDHWGTNPNP